MAEVFVDTGCFPALEIRADENHERALEHWRARKEEGLPDLISTTYVFDEVVTYLNARGLHASAVRIGNRLTESLSVELVHVDRDLFHAAFDLFSERPDKRYSLTDCLSFVLMRERGIARAFAFDRNFEQEGFTREPLEAGWR